MLLAARTLGVVGRGYKMRRTCRVSVGVRIATQPRSEAGMINFRELRQREVRRIPLPRTSVNKDKSTAARSILSRSVDHIRHYVHDTLSHMAYAWPSNKPQ